MDMGKFLDNQIRDGSYHNLNTKREAVLYILLVYIFVRCMYCKQFKLDTFLYVPTAHKAETNSEDQ